MIYQKYITIDKRIMAGKPIIKGTRIPVDLIVRKFAKTMDIDDLLKDYPRLTKEAVQAAIWYAGEVVGSEEIYPLSP
ncbi:hypothetical protein A3D78_01655 [Candidatus Gottesmanbacteria bacterium RIFCSPHIGHO2_02_FULL_39_14]|uniref:Antitoxin n=2 Tax=Candidatus Gottesmaniibacteriota TaxID=1752720 RepID=A0A1F5ZYJ3_9BACT|nr:MAG: hypothetical protein A3D78_01655 [Candidatus Gottesmanbacteria bacterium RIFCSPHIGHO2_02_FULL_39_14]OGG32331.1 MAG: hypothetical protein A3I51_02100 [Candidatus Gottesmanbacteria bacterium RIFCSPLOWO2_02_FULL_38_8]